MGNSPQILLFWLPLPIHLRPALEKLDSIRAIGFDFQGSTKLVIHVVDERRSTYYFCISDACLIIFVGAIKSSSGAFS